ncbi:unnamed protein product [Ilex paraguariensis]|uniref:Uncharacterized protein n=1 Tax=Ilex paraguariensis TaxID=185542 RepID=A0ABC8RMY0_9AQUA
MSQSLLSCNVVGAEVNHHWMPKVSPTRRGFSTEMSYPRMPKCHRHRQSTHDSHTEEEPTRRELDLCRVLLCHYLPKCPINYR